MTAISDLTERIAACRQAEDQLAYAAAHDPGARSMGERIAARRQILERELKIRSEMDLAAGNYHNCKNHRMEQDRINCEQAYRKLYWGKVNELKALQNENPTVYPDDGRPEQRVGYPCLKCLKDALNSAVAKYRCEPISGVQLDSVTYISEHQALRDQETDWSFTGKRYPDPEWTPLRSYPISHTWSAVQYPPQKHPAVARTPTYSPQYITLKIQLTVGPQHACPQTGTLVGVLSDGRVLYSKKGVTLKPGVNTVQLTAPKVEIENLDWMVHKVNFRLTWTFYGESVLSVGQSTNTLYQIFGPPLMLGTLEQGPTTKRMEKAVELVSNAPSTDFIDIISSIMSKMGQFYLSIAHLRNSLSYHHKAQSSISDTVQKVRKFDAIETQFQISGRISGFPQWFNTKHGAWPIADCMPYSGECQAICRFVIGVMHQVGADADIKLVFAYANYENPTIPIVDEVGNGPRQPGGNRFCAMVAGDVIVGQEFSGDQDSGIWNNFEAFLRYRDGEMEYYFGGGLGGVPHQFAKGGNYLPLVSNTFSGVALVENTFRKVKGPDGSERPIAIRKVIGFKPYPR